MHSTVESKLDRAFGLDPATTIAEATAANTIDRNTWMTADPDILAQIAHTPSRKVFYNQLVKMLKDAGVAEEYMPEIKQAIETGNTDFIKQIRREARNVAAERQVSAPKGSDLARKKETQDKLHLSPEEVAAQRQQINTAKQNAPKKSFPGDKLYGMFDQAGHLVRGGFNTEAEADQFRIGSTDTPEAYQIQQYDNPKSLSTLANTKGPLQSGWSEEEVVKTMMPYIMSIARKYTNSKNELEDLIQHGAIGVMNALKTDKSEAPFGTHAYRHILGEIRRAALNQGLIAGVDAAGAHGTGQQGGNIGYEVMFRKDENSPVESQFFASQPEAFRDYFSKTGRNPPRSIDPGYKEAVAFMQQKKAEGYVAAVRDKRGSMGSTDKQVGGSEGEPTSVGSLMKATKTKTPLQIAMNRDQVKSLMDNAGLSPQQKKVLELTFGLDTEGVEGGENWGTSDSRVAGKTGPLEGGEEGRLPGEQTGKTPEEAGINPALAKQSTDWSVPDGEGEKPRKVEVVRGPVEIGNMLGMSTERVRQHRQKAYDRLLQAANKSGFDHMKKKAQGKPTTAAEDKAFAGMRLFESFIRGLVFESVMAGESNGTIFG